MCRGGETKGNKRQSVGLTMSAQCRNIMDVRCCGLSSSTWSTEQHLSPTFQTDKPVTSVHQTLQKNVSTLPH